MPNRRGVAAVLVFSLSLAGAGCRTQLVNYDSPAGVPQAEAIRIITDALELQPRDFTFSAVEVTPERLAVTERNGGRLIFYFARLTEASIFKDWRGTYYFVLIRDRLPENYIRVWTPYLATAERLVDALRSMRAHATVEP